MFDFQSFIRIHQKLTCASVFNSKNVVIREQQTCKSINLHPERGLG